MFVVGEERSGRGGRSDKEEAETTTLEKLKEAADQGGDIQGHGPILSSIRPAWMPRNQYRGRVHSSLASRTVHAGIR